MARVRVFGWTKYTPIHVEDIGKGGGGIWLGCLAWTRTKPSDDFMSTAGVELLSQERMQDKA